MNEKKKKEKSRMKGFDERYDGRTMITHKKMASNPTKSRKAKTSVRSVCWNVARRVWIARDDKSLSLRG